MVAERSVTDFEEIARKSCSDEEALHKLQQHGASAVQAIVSLVEGRGLPIAEAKAKLVQSQAWCVEAASAKKLHDQIDTVLSLIHI